MITDNIVSAKKTNGQAPQNNPTTSKLYLNKVNVGLVPPLSSKEYELLKESIRENGLLVPIIVNQE